MKLIKKKNAPKTIEMVVSDMEYSFHKIISQNHPVLSITITNTQSKSEKDLNFKLTNKLFNSLHKDYKHTFEAINYLFVIEYPTKVSQGIEIPDNCDVHTHIVLGTTLPQNVIESYIQSTFLNPDIYIEDITKRNDKIFYINYLTKQRNYLTNEIYNYKIQI